MTTLQLFVLGAAILVPVAAVGVGMFGVVRQVLKARDAEWRMWAQDKGIDHDYPGYGYKRKLM